MTITKEEKSTLHIVCAKVCKIAILAIIGLVAYYHRNSQTAPVADATIGASVLVVMERLFS